ncbi:MAG TPA: TetR/AcrR family transcriptional regulator [Rhodocyclaceae bacterium]|nr:TetR/AcrR family transcriptional regulator [Rhodocyclaceae bacterium]
MLSKPLSLLKSLCCPLEKEGAASRPRQRRKEARPAELMAAALDLFVEKGFAATRLDDVAARAGVTKGTLYLYFDSKEALFKAVVENGIVPIIDEALRQLEEYQGSMADLLADMIQRWWRDLGATPLGGIPKLIVSEAGNFPEVAAYYHEAVIQRGERLIKGILLAGVERGEFRSIDVEAAYHVVIATVLMLVIWRHSFAVCGEGIDPDRYLAANIDLVLNGLRNSTES